MPYHRRMEEAPATPRPGPRFRIQARPKDSWFLLVVAVIVAADQFTKWVIRQSLERGDSNFDIGVFRIVHITNTGAAFGILTDAGPLLALTSLIGIAAIVIYILNPSFAQPVMRVGLALMLGGAIGNLIDRVDSGEVVDFLKVPHWPAFNVADSAITVGVLFLVWAMLRDPKPSSTAGS